MSTSRITPLAAKASVSCLAVNIDKLHLPSDLPIPDLGDKHLGRHHAIN